MYKSLIYKEIKIKEIEYKRMKREIERLKWQRILLVIMVISMAIFANIG